MRELLLAFDEDVEPEIKKNLDLKNREVSNLVASSAVFHYQASGEGNKE